MIIKIFLSLCIFTTIFYMMLSTSTVKYKAGDCYENNDIEEWDKTPPNKIIKVGKNNYLVNIPIKDWLFSVSFEQKTILFKDIDKNTHKVTCPEGY